MKEFPNVSLVVMHSNMNINMDSNKRVHKQTHNKQTNKHVWAFKKKDSNHLISQNVHHINHNKDINKWSGRGLICMDFHPYCHRDLWFHQCSLISNDMIKAQYLVDDPSAGTTAWHRILMLLMSWPAENKRHNPTQKDMFFIDSSWPLVFILQLFNWDLIPYFEIQWNLVITRSLGPW